jgi:hypothetical protein
VNPAPDDGTRSEVACHRPLRVLVMQHVQDDTYAVIENGDVSLSDKASLTLLLKQLSGRDHP